MYIPAAFQETHLPTLHDFIEQHSFGLLVSQVDGQPFATPLPFLLERDCGPYGTLVGHTARANPQCQAAQGQSLLAIFSGPHAYVSPTWYEAENVVPTWNYVTVHATGKLQIIDDESALLDLVQTLTAFHERTMPAPWSLDGSSSFAKRLLPQITGFRIPIESLEGKWKLSQNHPVDRQRKVVRALMQRTNANSQGVASLMHERLARDGDEVR
jgi:transcriptional regulator